MFCPEHIATGLGLITTVEPKVIETFIAVIEEMQFPCVT